MANLAQALKNEISRIARRESKAIVEPIKKASADLRGTLSALRRQQASQEREIAQLRKQLGKASPAAAKAAEQDEPGTRHRISAKGVKALREKLGLSAERLASLVGVSGQTIYLWERGKTSPRAKPLAALVKLRGIGKKEAQALLEAQDGVGKPAAPKKPAKATKRVAKKTAATKGRAGKKPAAKRAQASKTSAASKPADKKAVAKASKGAKPAAKKAATKVPSRKKAVAKKAGTKTTTAVRKSKAPTKKVAEAASAPPAATTSAPSSPQA